MLSLPLPPSSYRVSFLGATARAEWGFREDQERDQFDADDTAFLQYISSGRGSDV